MKYQKLIPLFIGVFATVSFATDIHPSIPNNQHLLLQSQSGFFRFSYDNMKMPSGMQSMGLLGFNYFANLTPTIYGGIGTYGSITGTQGGLFTLGFGGGFHHELFPHLWGDMGMYVGGGGGHSSLVGGGLMIRPHIGIDYDFRWFRLGMHYSYIDFPSGQIRSSQVGVDLDIPYDFYYAAYQNSNTSLFKFDDIHLLNGKYLDFQKNDLGILLQRYLQPSGTHNVTGAVQDDPMGIVGAELDHYITNNTFWWLKAGGSFSGETNGYMDVLAGLGYHFPLGTYGFAFVPQVGLGAGGGGNVDTGGGVLIQPQLGFEWPFSRSFSGRLSGGYLWAPKGQFKATTITGEILYHLDFATANNKLMDYASNIFKLQSWQLQFFNQTYLRPQRSATSTVSPDNLMGVQLDQYFTPHFFFSYQGASAYAGYHAGGYATGMIGPGIQTTPFYKQHLQLFGELLVGAGGGGGLALGGGALVEPVVGVHYALTNAFGLQASLSQVKALHNDLNTPVFNIGFTIRFDTLNKE